MTQTWEPQLHPWSPNCIHIKFPCWSSNFVTARAVGIQLQRPLDAACSVQYRLAGPSCTTCPNLPRPDACDMLMCTNFQPCLSPCTCACKAHTHLYASTRKHIHLNMRMHMHMQMHMHIDIHIHMHIHTHMDILGTTCHPKRALQANSLQGASFEPRLGLV